VTSTSYQQLDTTGTLFCAAASGLGRGRRDAVVRPTRAGGAEPYTAKRAIRWNERSNRQTVFLAGVLIALGGGTCRLRGTGEIATDDWAA